MRSIAAATVVRPWIASGAGVIRSATVLGEFLMRVWRGWPAGGCWSETRGSKEGSYAKDIIRLWTDGCHPPNGWIHLSNTRSVGLPAGRPPWSRRQPPGVLRGGKDIPPRARVGTCPPAGHTADVE